MVHKYTVYTDRCPYCGKTISGQHSTKDPWGMKFGRCYNCRGIYRTGKKLYSDTPERYRKEDRAKFVKHIKISIVSFLVALLMACITKWVFLGVIAFGLFAWAFVESLMYYDRRKMTLRKFEYLKNRDPELYRLEYEESMRIASTTR